jgi:hypothetical protein
MKAFSEVILLLHEVGQALVRDVEEVDEGLHVSSLQQMTANTLPTVVLVFLGSRHARCQVLALFITLSPQQGIVLLGDLVEKNGRTGGLRGLLDRLDLFLLFAHLPYAIFTPSFASAFIGNSKLIAIITPIKLSATHTHAHTPLTFHTDPTRTHLYCPKPKICKLYIMSNRCIVGCIH